MKTTLCSLFLLLVLCGWGIGCAPGHYLMSENAQTASPEEAVQNAKNYLINQSDWKIDCSHFVLTCYHSAQINHFLKHQRGDHNLVRDLNAYLENQKGRRVHACLLYTSPSPRDRQ